ncbi:MAG: IS66 family insertion sequence element accessory protein TnpB [Paracoccaceae bacterium]|nr:IS66 family insertion sequence element accessory protein TnpB [Paracoccaceae bacterium]
MLPTNGVRILVATRPVDFRKGHDGLAALVQNMLRENPFSGMVFVFRAKRADRLKLLYWDGSGLVMACHAPGRQQFHLARHSGRCHDAEPCAVRSPFCRS